MPPIPLSRPFVQALLFWLLFAVPVVLLGGLSLDTDSAMRLAQVRDLLHGQSWFDTAQWRLNTPFGVPMHWSRLVDAPIAALIAVAGERVALTIWPLLIFLAALWALARIALHAGGRAAVPVVLVLSLLCVFLLPIFAPGSIDHHNVQLALMLATLLAVIERRPVPAALCVVLGLGVGLEVLPYAVLAVLAVMTWHRDQLAKLRVFGLGLAIVAILLLFGTTARAYRFAPVCDTYSVFYAAPLIAGGLGLAAISFLPRHRFAALGSLGCGVALLAAMLNRDCLSGPYGGMNAQLRDIFLSRINEAHSAFEFFTFAPSEWMGGFFYACMALTACLFAPRRPAKTLIIAFAAMALAVSLWQVRAVPFAILFALPGLAAALARLMRVQLLAGVLALLLGNQAAFAAAGVLFEGAQRHETRIAAFRKQVACADPANLAPLTALPPGRVAAFVDQGPAILATTKHSVIAGPYHRDAQGILDTYKIFSMKQDQARSLLKGRGIGYVMTCAAAPDWNFYIRQNPSGLLSLLAAGHTPDWLQPVAARGDVRLYRVR